jgi:hypothetical protein
VTGEGARGCVAVPVLRLYLGENKSVVFFTWTPRDCLSAGGRSGDTGFSADRVEALANGQVESLRVHIPPSKRRYDNNMD